MSKETVQTNNTETQTIMPKPKRAYNKKNKDETVEEKPKRSYTVKPKDMSEEETKEFYKERKKHHNILYKQKHYDVIRQAQDRYFAKPDVQQKLKAYREKLRSEKQAMNQLEKPKPFEV